MNPLVSGDPPPFILHRKEGRENNPLVKQAKDEFKQKVVTETLVSIFTDKKEAVKNEPQNGEQSEVYGDWFIPDYKSNIIGGAVAAENISATTTTTTTAGAGAGAGAGASTATPAAETGPAPPSSAASVALGLKTYPNEANTASCRIRLEGVISQTDYDKADLEERSEIVADVQEECIRVCGGASSGYVVNVAYDFSASESFVPLIVTVCGKFVNKAVEKIYNSLNGRSFGGSTVLVKQI